MRVHRWETLNMTTFYTERIPIYTNKWKISWKDENKAHGTVHRKEIIH